MEFQRVKRTLPPVPIIPLIDILAILLIYFAVAYDPKIERPVLPVELVVAQDSVTLKVVGASSVLAVAADGSMQLDATRIHDGMLAVYLKVFREKFPKRKLELEIDKNLPFGDVIEVQMALIDAGFDLKQVPVRVRTPETSTQPQQP